MKKTFKGFTLVECLIAMAILAIAGTLMASIYANVSQKNNSNQFMNTSLANQMKYIEQYIDAETVPIYYGNASTDTPDTEASSGSATKYPPHKKTLTTNYNYVKVTKLNSGGSAVVDGVYSFPADIFVMYSRDSNDAGSDEATYVGIAKSISVDSGSEKSGNLRYKYILGHKN